MEEQRILHETARLAREKKFDFPNKSSQNDYQGERPTQSLLQKWLRDEHKIDIMIEPCTDIDSKEHFYEMTLVYDWSEEDSSDGSFYSYEDALEDGLLEALKLIN